MPHSLSALLWYRCDTGGAGKGGHDGLDGLQVGRTLVVYMVQEVGHAAKWSELDTGKVIGAPHAVGQICVSHPRQRDQDSVSA